MKRNKLVDASVIFVGIVVLAIVLKTLDSFLRPFVISLLITFLLQPLMKFSKKIRIPFSIVLILLLSIFVSSIFFVSSFVKVDDLDFNEKLPIYQNQINLVVQNINSVLSFSGVEINLKQVFNSDNVGKMLTKLIQGVRNIITEFFLALLFLLFLIPAHKKLIKDADKHLNKSKMEKFRSAFLEIEKSIIDYLSAKSIISFGTAFVSFFVLLYFKSDFIFLIVFLIFIMNFIPNIGSIFAVALALVIYFLTYGLIWNLIWLGLVLTAIQILFGNILEPKFAGKQLKLSPLLIILSLFIWYWIWGVVGMMLAVPIASIVKIIFAHINSTKDVVNFIT